MDSTGNRHVILSGCSGGGKSTVLGQLALHGFATIAEPGRRIVAEEVNSRGTALPWVDLSAFALRAIEVSCRDRACLADRQEWVFFDRGLIDAAVALEYATGIPASKTLEPHDRFHHQVFLTPPWPEIYKTDNARQHDFSDAVREYDRLRTAFDTLGYETVIVPKTDVQTRADFVLDHLL